MICMVPMPPSHALIADCQPLSCQAMASISAGGTVITAGAPSCSVGGAGLPSGGSTATSGGLEAFVQYCRPAAATRADFTSALAALVPVKLGAQPGTGAGCGGGGTGTVIGCGVGAGMAVLPAVALRLVLDLVVVVVVVVDPVLVVVTGTGAWVVVAGESRLPVSAAWVAAGWPPLLISRTAVTAKAVAPAAPPIAQRARRAIP